VSVSPFLVNRKTNSDLGWAFAGLIDAGRLKAYADDGADITRIYRHQLAACTYEVLRGATWRASSVPVPSSRCNHHLRRRAISEKPRWLDEHHRGVRPHLAKGKGKRARRGVRTS
jgi:hypothetical protein